MLRKTCLTIDRSIKIYDERKQQKSCGKNDLPAYISYDKSAFAWFIINYLAGHRNNDLPCIINIEYDDINHNKSYIIRYYKNCREYKYNGYPLYEMVHNILQYQNITSIFIHGINTTRLKLDLND